MNLIPNKIINLLLIYLFTLNVDAQTQSNVNPVVASMV